MKSKYKVVLFTLGNVSNFNQKCKAKLFSENGIKELSQRSQDFYDCISKNFEIAAWGCGRHEFKELNLSNSVSMIPKINRFVEHLDEIGIDYDIIIQMGCHPNVIHKKPYFIYTDSGFSNVTKMEDLDYSFFPQNWCNANIETDIFHDVFSSASAILTMSPLTSYCLCDVNGISKNKISCIGAEAKGFVGNDYKKERKKSINILWVGGKFEEKGGYAILESFSKLQTMFTNIRLQMVGIDSIPEIYNHNMDNVEIIPFTDDCTYLDSIYKNSDIFILPSLREAFGLVYIEAMARKLPVTVSSRSGLASVIKHNDIGEVVSPNDIESIVNILSNWITNIENAYLIGEKGYNFALNNFTEDIISNRVREVIENTMENETIINNYIRQPKN